METRDGRLHKRPLDGVASSLWLPSRDYLKRFSVGGVGKSRQEVGRYFFEKASGCFVT